MSGSTNRVVIDGVRPDVSEYNELRIRIDRASEGSYRVLASTRSAEAHGSFELPFNELEQENFVLRLSRPRDRRRLGSSALGDAKRFGGELFGALFRGQVHNLYRDALGEARAGGRGLRITLCLSGSPELIDVPWEFLFDPPDFLAISALTPVVRYLDLPRGHRPLVVEPPLRILGVVSSPADYERLDVERERANLEGALSRLTESRAVELQWLEQPTLERLLRTLQAGVWHGLHYIGHGSYDRESDRGLLLFEDESGWGRAVSGEKLGTVLHDFTSLRLAVLNACEGGRTSRGDPFAGVAESLVQREIPAVIAMQFEVSDEAAITFAEGFYSSVATGSPVDAAVAAARLAMFAKRSDDIEWGTPALYMRVPDGRIFDLGDARSHADGPALDASNLAAAAAVRTDVPPEPKPAPGAATGSQVHPRGGGPSVDDADQSTAHRGRGPQWARHRYRALVLGVVLFVGVASAVLVSALSGQTTYPPAVSKLCALDNSQHQMVLGSMDRLQTELLNASDWQRQRRYLLQDVDNRMTDANNLLIDVEALQLPTATAASRQGAAAGGLKASLAALSAYQLRLESVGDDHQLLAAATALEHTNQQFLAEAETTRVALAKIGGPSCLSPEPALPVILLHPFGGCAPVTQNNLAKLCHEAAWVLPEPQVTLCSGCMGAALPPMASIAPSPSPSGRRHAGSSGRHQ